VRSITFILATFLCAGCAPFQTLPPGDPVWQAAVGDRNPFVLSGAPTPPLPKASVDQHQATERVKAYLGKSLPVSAHDLVEKLRRQNFSCDLYGGGVGWECDYTRAHPPEPCVESLRVSVEVNFPTTEYDWNTVTPQDMDVAAMVIPDPDHGDDRGCLPM
jgi:hypothetical protein